MSFEFVTKLPTPTEIKEQYPVPEEIKALVEERKQARAEKNWVKSDEIRDRIISLGYSIKDTKDGIIVKKEN